MNFKAKLKFASKLLLLDFIVHVPYGFACYEPSKQHTIRCNTKDQLINARQQKPNKSFL